MVRRIIWTSKADKVFTDILEFYIRRNGTKTYSRKINNEIDKLLNLLKNHPFLGKKTDTENIRVIIHRDFKIFYRIQLKEIIILMVWDCRQDPAEFHI